MARLTITGEGPTLRDLVVALDGHPIRDLRELDLTLREGEFNAVEILVMVDDVRISAEAMASLIATDEFGPSDRVIREIIITGDGLQDRPEPSPADTGD